MKISLRAARVNANLTIIEAKDKIGVDYTTLCRWEKNPNTVKAESQDKICEVYGIAKEQIDWSEANEKA